MENKKNITVLIDDRVIASPFSMKVRTSNLTPIPAEYDRSKTMSIKDVFPSIRAEDSSNTVASDHKSTIYGKQAPKNIREQYNRVVGQELQAEIALHHTRSDEELNFDLIFILMTMDLTSILDHAG